MEDKLRRKLRGILQKQLCSTNEMINLPGIKGQSIAMKQAKVKPKFSLTRVEEHSSRAINSQVKLQIAIRPLQRHKQLSRVLSHPAKLAPLIRLNEDNNAKSSKKAISKSNKTSTKKLTKTKLTLIKPKLDESNSKSDNIQQSNLRFNYGNKM